MYDLIIIGAGPGGYPAAVLASKNGLKVSVIGKENFTKEGNCCYYLLRSTLVLIYLYLTK
jgi:pyruvate/2-oxoglutarate dehydrogenase complex dihydrolipoamide dehydrogenase (E3) component